MVLYLASIEEHEIDGSFLVFKELRASTIKTQEPVMDMCELEHLAQFDQ